MPDLTGLSLGRYHILEQLGEGGMATVYKAYDTRLEREVALKVLRTDQFIPAQLQMVLQRFEREAKSLAKLKHPNIVNILDFGEHEGMPFLVMEYLPGGTLKQKLGGKIPWQAAIQSLIPVARGLAYAHQHGIIHRDVKPANILIDENNEPVLTDFGIAKLLEASDGQTLTASGVGIGTPEYMAPEQGLGEKSIDARADIYALGIVLYEMVAGRKPYSADTPMAVVLKQISDPLPRPADFAPGLPASVESVLFKALAKQPDDRYQDMAAMLAALENLLLEAPTVPLPETVAAAPPLVEKPPAQETQEKAPAMPESAPVQQAEKKPAPRLRLAPRLILAVVGTLAIVLAALFGLPWLMSQVPTSPVQTATPGATLAIIPTSTAPFLPPTATPGPSPTITLTRTSRPTSTATPFPAWVADFAEPILAALKDRQPYFEDDFSNTEPKGWFGLWLTDKYGPITIENGVLRLEEGEMVANSYLSGKANYAIQVEVSRPVACCTQISFRGDGTLSLGPSEWGLCPRKDETDNCYNSDYSFSPKILVLILIRGSQAAFYFDGKPVYYYRDNLLATPSAFSEPHFFCGGNYCELDNLKAWNITYLPTPTPTSTARPAGASSSGPTWATDFADPIQAYIANRPPDIQDQFQSATEAWEFAFRDVTKDWQKSTKNGEMLLRYVMVQNKSIVFHDYVAEITIQPPKGTQTTGYGITFSNGTGDFSAYNIQMCRFSITNNEFDSRCMGKNFSGNINSQPPWRLQLIIKGGRIAIHINDEPMVYFDDDRYRLYRGDAPQFYLGAGPEAVAFSNFKVWNITKLEVP